MVGPDSSLLGGLVVAFTLFTLNYIIKLISYKNKLFSKILEGEPVMQVYKGFIKSDNLQKQKLTLDELEAVVREHGIEKVKDAELVMLEKDGSFSVISKDLKNQTIRKYKTFKNNKINAAINR
jgi:uncharacterized membrane protein YcaP (DUF421 family)